MDRFLKWLKGEREVPHPTAVERARVEPVHTPAHYPVGSIIDSPTTRVELAPQPQPDSAYWHVGKCAPRFVRPVTNLAIAEWQSVQAWPFTADRRVIPLRVPIGPHQAMNPFGERVNVDMPAQTTLGATTTIKAVPQHNAEYAKLGWL